MKKFMLVLVVLSLIGCSNPVSEVEVPNSPEARLQGRWYYVSPWEDDYLLESTYWEFSGNNWRSYDETPVNGHDIGGTFTCTETTIDFTTTYFVESPGRGRVETYETRIYTYTIGDSTFYPDYSRDPNNFFTLSDVLSLNGPSGSIGGRYKKL